MRDDDAMSDDWSPRTRLVHGGARRSQYGETSEAIFLTQGFVYPSAEVAEARFIASGPDEFIYARYGNPTVRMFEERMAALEGAEDAFATASGMAAVHGALFCQLKAGDHVVSARALFGSCLYIVETLLPRFGVRVDFVDGADLDQWAAAIRPETRLVFLESIANPTLEVIDIAGVAALAHARGAQVIVDNVFATPIFQRCLELGADVVIYSATKHIDGQGRCLGGMLALRPDHRRVGRVAAEDDLALRRRADAPLEGRLLAGRAEAVGEQQAAQIGRRLATGAPKAAAPRRHPDPAARQGGRRLRGSAAAASVRSLSPASPAGHWARRHRRSRTARPTRAPGNPAPRPAPGSGRDRDPASRSAPWRRGA